MQEDDLEVYFACEVNVSEFGEDRIAQIVRVVCQDIAIREELAPAEVSITIVDGDTIQELNRTYRQLDRVTDVLSFALLESVDESLIEADDDVQAMGDIVVCWPRLCEQAEEYGHSIERELAFLTAHGFYHLLGYDHQTEETERTMITLQETVLSTLGFVR